MTNPGEDLGAWPNAKLERAGKPARAERLEIAAGSLTA
jgi:hypothetical protein